MSTIATFRRLRAVGMVDMVDIFRPLSRIGRHDDPAILPLGRTAFIEHPAAEIPSGEVAKLVTEYSSAEFPAEFFDGGPRVVKGLAGQCRIELERQALEETVAVVNQDGKAWVMVDRQWHEALPQVAGTGWSLGNSRTNMV